MQMCYNGNHSNRSGFCQQHGLCVACIHGFSSSRLARQSSSTSALNSSLKSIQFSTVPQADLGGYRPDEGGLFIYATSLKHPGFVSFVWGLPPPGDVPLTLFSHCDQISQHELEPGDAIILPSAFVVLFGGWVGPDAFSSFALRDFGDVCRSEEASFSFFQSQGFFPCRFRLACV